MHERDKWIPLHLCSWVQLHELPKWSLTYVVQNQPITTVMFFPEIDTCESSPCLNGGTCVKDINGYHCDCTPEHNYTHCENGLDCAYTWSTWSSCNITCGAGDKTRTVTITRNNGNGGNPCPASPDVAPCSLVSCDADCVEGPWNVTLDECDAECGDEKVRKKSRKAVIERQGNGKECDALEDIENCELKKCVSSVHIRFPCY